MADTDGTVKATGMCSPGLKVKVGECDPTGTTIVVRTGFKSIYHVSAQPMESGASEPYWSVGSGLDADKVTITVTSGKKHSFAIFGID